MSDKPKTSNQRSKIRHLINVPVLLVDKDGNEYVTLSDNVSDCGLFVEMEVEDYPAVGTVVTVQVMTPLGDGSEAPINRAEVVRHDARGIGLRFLFDDD